MDSNIYSAERIKTVKWYEHTRTWDEALYYDAAASISPETAKAGQASDWKIDIELGDMELEAGDHIAIEINVTWTTDRGRPFLYGRSVFEEKWDPGYGATPKISLPAGVEYDFAITEPARMNRYFIIDVVLKSGVIKKGTRFSISLADPEGTLIRCPWYAQIFPIPVAVKKKKDTYFMRIKKIPYLKVIASEPRKWKTAATLQPGHAAALVRVIAADGMNMNPAQDAPEPEILTGDDWELTDLQKCEGYNGAALWKGTAVIKNTSKAEGAGSTPLSDKSDKNCIEFFNRAAGLYGRSNCIKPLYKDMQVYFGDLHGQSDRSIGFGSEREYFSWARDAELLDFVAPANHYGGRENVTDELWKYTLDKCDEFHKPGEFVTLYSYEWGGGKNAHRNVYYENMPGKLFDAHRQEYGEIGLLWKELDKQGLKAITIPHHPKFIGRINWNEFNPKYQRLVEVCSCWGNSEMNGPHSVQAGLNMGHRIGVVGGTDTHFSQPGRSAFGPYDLGGITGVICGKLDRNDIWNALFNRRCYATTGEKILLDFRINGEMMGSELDVCSTRQITGSVIGTANIEWVEIVRNGEVWKRYDIQGSKSFEFSEADNQEFNDIALTPKVDVPSRFVYYYIRTQQSDNHWAMSSPIWIDGR